MTARFSPAFLVNDPHHSPFGASWLRGITPVRVAVFVAVCSMIAITNSSPTYLLGDYSHALWFLWDRFGRALACATPMFILIIKTDGLTAQSSPQLRIGALVLAVVVGAVSYAALRTGVRFLHGTVANPALLWEASLAYFVRTLLAGGILTAILYFAARERDAARRLHQTRLLRVEIERQLAESKLNLLRAQIEPHFLFNSLASVKRLYAGDKSRGRALLANLAGYLRAATSSFQRREVPLGEEIALVKSFLEIFQVRMGRRLRVRIDVPDEHQAALVPPLAIGTLVENAIKHGIGPRDTGGTVTLAAHREGQVLVVGVADDGVGFRVRSGRGVGLANTRARLDAMFGAAASLDLDSNLAGGVTATLRVPYRVAA
jgi:two-component sensor histidine kinase